MLRTALAMGADKAVHVNIPDADYEKMTPLHVAKLMAKYVQDEKFDVVILGKQVCITTLYSLHQVIQHRFYRSN